ncbi:MAG: toll/interleukin-1 receptor domain-containing protein [Bacillota bacterium]|nr:toll/interleukin-1 receptor domain-containing protein [Bacillota bacterium]
MPAIEGWHLFACYADDDHDFVTGVVEELTNRGYQVFYARRDNVAGVVITERIRVALVGSSYYLLFLSPRLVARYLSRSLAFAELVSQLANQQVSPETIIPIWYDMNLDQEGCGLAAARAA